MLHITTFFLCPSAPQGSATAEVTCPVSQGLLAGDPPTVCPWHQLPGAPWGRQVGEMCPLMIGLLPSTSSGRLVPGWAPPALAGLSLSGEIQE